MEGIIFEEVREEHLPQLAEIYNYYVQNSTATFHSNPLSPEDMRGIVFFNVPRFKSYIINYQGELCGYGILSRYKPREAYDITAEVTIYLKPGYTGKGLGSAAVNLIEETARKEDFKSLLAIICGENIESIRLFEKKGYTKCAHFNKVGQKFGRLLDVVCYQKMLV